MKPIVINDNVVDTLHLFSTVESFAVQGISMWSSDLAQRAIDVANAAREIMELLRGDQTLVLSRPLNLVLNRSVDAACNKHTIIVH
jgi:hypothetical protein